MNVGKTLIWLGLIGVFVGAIFLNWLLDYYLSEDLLLAVGIPGLGLFFLMKGLSKLGRRGVGIAVFVLGAGAIAAVVFTAKSRRQAMQRAWENERAAGEVAQAVCAGKPNTAATAAKGPRAIMSVTGESTSKSKYANKWDGLPAPKTIADLQLVACRETSEQTIRTCQYVSSPESTVPSYTVYLAKTVYRITVRDAKTAAALGEETFEGGMPATGCNEKIHTREHFGSRTETGSSPSHQEQTAFLQTFVKPAAE